MKHGEIHVTITGNADPLVAELRRVERELARLRLERSWPARLRRAFEVGRRFERALAEVRAVVSRGRAL